MINIPLYKYIGWLYIRYFAILFIAINSFYVTLDTIFNKALPEFINLKILFVFYSFIESITMTLTLVLIFAFVVTMVRLIKANIFVCLLSFGYSKRMILQPFIFITIAIIIASVAINLTDLAYATQKKKNILDYQTLYTNKENIFLKYNNSYVYFEELMPIKQSARGIKIYQFDDSLQLQKIYYANKAIFKEDSWILKKAQTIIYPKDKNFANTKLFYQDEHNVKTLEGFQPKIISSIYERHLQISIVDALNLIKIFTSQYINTNKARAALYKSLLVPFFALFTIMIFFSYTPTTKRLSNTPLYISAAMTISLCLFGIFKVFEHLSFNAKGLDTELLTLMPLSLLFSLALWRYIKIE